jgi:CheY-like chemotaxis protein
MTVISNGAGTSSDLAIGIPAVLIIDADPVRRHRSALMLKRLGYASPQIAESAEHAAALIGDQGCDLLLLELATDEPDMPGSVCAWLRTQPPPGPRIIAVTGEDAADLRGSCLAPRLAAQLTRPLTRDALAAALAAVPADDADEDFNAATWAEWSRLYGDAALAEVVAVMTADLAEQQRRFAAAAQGRDGSALRHVAHALRGASLQFGAAALADLCNRAESAAAAGDAEQALSLGQRMMARHAALVARLQRHSTQVHP